MKQFILFVLGLLLPSFVFSQSVSATTSDTNSEVKKEISVKVEMGVLASNSDNDHASPFSLLNSVNFKITPKLSLGIGMGIEFLNETNMPLFATSEYRLKANKSTPYLFVKAGYSVSLDNEQKSNLPINYRYISAISELDAKGGWLANAGVGYAYTLNNNLVVSLALGYRYQQLNYKMDKYDYKMSIDYHRLSIYLGVTF